MGRSSYNVAIPKETDWETVDTRVDKISEALLKHPAVLYELAGRFVDPRDRLAKVVGPWETAYTPYAGQMRLVVSGRGVCQVWEGQGGTWLWRVAKIESDGVSDLTLNGSGEPAESEESAKISADTALWKMGFTIVEPTEAGDGDV